MLSSAIGAAASGASSLKNRATGATGENRVHPSPDGLEVESAGEDTPKPSGMAPVSGAAHRISQAAVSGVGAAANIAGSAASAAAPAAGFAAGVASTAAGTAKDSAKGAADAAYQKASDIASLSKERMQEVIGRLRHFLEALVKQKIQQATEKAVDRLPGLAKSMLEDGEMPRCVSRGKDRLVENVWPDLREEIMWEVAVFMDGLPEEETDPRNGVDCFRAFFRYHLFPYDKGFWGQLRDPVFIMFKLATIVPVYGVSQFLFLFVFLIIDKTDEFQLISFILGFKGTQFISMGIIRAVTGFAMFMMCVTAEARENHHTCEDSGPGNKGALLISIAGFFLQVVLVWAAFLVLPCAKEKGRGQLAGHVNHEHGGHAGVSGGFIRYFLWYDLAFFVLALCLPLYVMITRPDAKDSPDSDWVLAHSVFAAQVIYGLLAAPFFLFTLPGLQRVLTHAMPTAYDRNGRCRKPKKRPRKDSPQRPAAGELISDGDAESVFQKMRELIMPGKRIKGAEEDD